MQFIPRNVKKFQQGGEMMPSEEMSAEEMAPEAAPEEMAPQGGGQDPLMMLVQGAMQALQNQDCQTAMQVCQGLIQLVQQMSGGGASEQQGEPVFRKGGVLLRRIRK